MTKQVKARSIGEGDNKLLKRHSEYQHTISGLMYMRVELYQEAELKRKGVTYTGLVERLAAIGVDEKEVNIRNKLSRGKFTAASLIQCL